jgi:ferredoxin
MAFLEELARYGERVNIVAEDESGMLDLDGALGCVTSGTVVYCCGPEGLLEAVEDRSSGWPAGTLHVERFAPRTGALDGPRNGFEVVLDASGITLEVRADETIADVLERAGVDIATSCREGTCGTCETVVLDGEIDHRDSFLAPEDRDSGEVMMICCSRALGRRLVLDL